MDILQLIHKVTWPDLPLVVQQQARRCLLDTLGAALGGRKTAVAAIMYDYAATVYGGNGAHLWWDGRPVSPPGAALAHAMTIDSLDIHDGHPLTKGHAGAAVVPALFALLRDDQSISGEELLTRLAVGYEIALRAGITLHATACDYHTSGAWNALGCAAIGARALGLTSEQTRHALCIAVYYGPRSQMMRCIDHPAMVKDGTGWGAMTGVSAALLAQQGFTGAPAVTVESPEAAPYWRTLGEGWEMLQQYFKPHAVCRWAQPAIEAAVALQHSNGIQSTAIEQVVVRTFHNAVRLNMRRPQDSDQAQYSLPFPVAAALVYGKLGGSELTGAALTDPAVLALVDKVVLVEDDAFTAQFPARRFAQVTMTTTEGRRYVSPATEARWDGADPPTDEDLRAKFRWLAAESLPAAVAADLEHAIWHCAAAPTVDQFVKLLTHNNWAQL
ncbi:MAG: MmgE/PrpD family protein [Caldilineaceae bacterium]